METLSPVTLPGPIKLSTRAESTLTAWAWELLDGALQLWQLPPSLLTWHTLAYEDGRASLRAELTRSESDADRYYRHAFNPAPPIEIGPSYADLEKLRAEMYRGTR